MKVRMIHMISIMGSNSSRIRVILEKRVSLMSVSVSERYTIANTAMLIAIMGPKERNR